MEITREEARALVYDDLAGWKLEYDSKKIIGQRRWVTEYSAVFKDLESGRTFQMCYELGSTEIQDDTQPFEYEDPVLVEVVLKEVVKEEWVAV